MIYGDVVALITAGCVNEINDIVSQSTMLRQNSLTCHLSKRIANELILDKFSVYK